MAILLATIFVGVLVYRRIKKRRARKRAIKLAAVYRTVSSPVAVGTTTDQNLPEDEVIIIGRARPASNPPPYSGPSPDPYESSVGPTHLTVPRFEYPGTYIRDKPPSYSATVLRVQNS